MLQAADLTIRLHPEDDVVIARVEIPAGTLLTKENVRAAARIPAGHKIAVRASPRASRRTATTRSSASPRATSRAGDHVHVHNLAMGDFRARLRFFVADVKKTELRRTARRPSGHRPRRRPRRDAQLHRHPHQRELLGDRCAHDRAGTSRTASTTFPTSTAWWR